MEATGSKFKIILGSSSVHRQKVLAEMGHTFTIMTADIDEKSIRRNTPEEMVMAIAEAKAEAIIAKLPIDYYKQDAEPPLLITGDQVVVYEGKVREKPSSKEEARQFIKGYSSGTAGTVSSVLVTNLKSGLSKGDWEKAERLVTRWKTKNNVCDIVYVFSQNCMQRQQRYNGFLRVVDKIHFHAIPDQVIDNLIQEKMVLNVAGALISEHPLLLPYVKQLVGTTESMMGLPKALTERLILEAL